MGRYRLVHELGQSYLGPLWAVRAEGVGGAAQLGTLRLVSLDGLSAETRVRLLEAAWQAMEVRGDFVSPVTDVVASDGELGVVSDYAEGVTLRALSNVASVRRKPVPHGVALRIVLDLLDATAALHQASAELGDEAIPLFGGLSADSVLVCTSGRTVVVDTAVASAASAIESFAGASERIAYAAPEQLAAAPTADARTDVFAAGVLAWELFSGRRLFIGSDKALAQKVLTAKIPRLDEARRKGDPAIPAAVQRAVMKALERDPAKRFQTAAEFSEALAGSAGHGTASADVTEYVSMVAEGPLTRVREALQNAESGAHEAVAPISLRPTRASAAPKRSSNAPKRPSGVPARDASPNSVPWAKLMPTSAQEALRARTSQARATAPAVAATASAAPANIAPTPAAKGAEPAPPQSAPVAASAPVARDVGDAQSNKEATAKASLPSPRRPSGTGKIVLPRSPGTSPTRASTKRPTLQGGWVLPPATVEELAGARPAAAAPAPAPEAPPAAKAAQKPMVKVGSSLSFGKKAGGGPSAEGALTTAYPSSSPPGVGNRARQATMIGIPPPASPSSPDIDPGDDERTRDFADPPPSSTRATEQKAEPRGAEPVATSPERAATRFDARLVSPGAPAVTSAPGLATPEASPDSAPTKQTTSGMAAFMFGGAGDVEEPSEAPAPSSGAKTGLLEDDEEPTHQYNPKDLLRQVEAMGRAGESGLLRAPMLAPPIDDGPTLKRPSAAKTALVDDGPTLKRPSAAKTALVDDDPTLKRPSAETPGAPSATVTEERATMEGAPPVDGGWLDEPENTAVEPAPELDGLDAIDELLGKSVALAPPSPPPEEPAPPAFKQATSRTPGFPAPAPSAASPSLIPSHVPPPLIHDPRANRPTTGRIAAPVKPKSGASRWLLVAGLSLLVLCASAAISLYVLRGRNAAASRDATPAPAPTTAVVEAPPKAEDPAPAEVPAPAPAAAESAAATTNAAPAAENPAPAAEPSAAPATEPSAAPATENAAPAQAAATEAAEAPAPSAESSAAAPVPPPRATVSSAPKAAAVLPAPKAAPAPIKATAPAPRAPAPVKATAPAPAAKAPASAPAKRPAPKKKSRNVPDDI